MLQQMRKFSKGIISTIFMGLLALTFVAWGIGDIFRGHVDTDVATMSSSAISYQMFNRDYHNVLRNEGMRQRREITPDEARKAGWGNAVLQQMIDRQALDTVVDSLGLTASDGDVAARIKKIDAFDGPLGTFDRKTFEKTLSERGFSEPEFIATMRGDMARSQLVAPIESGFEIPPGYAHALFAYSSEMRAAEYVTLTAKSLAPAEPPSDEVLTAYIKAHAARFSTPEYRSVTVAMIGPEDVAPSITVTDDQVRKEYELRKSIYVIPEKRDLQQISFADESSAAAARAKIDGGMSFEDAAKASGKAVDERPGVAKDDLAANGEAVFALAEGGVSAPLKNFAGWALMRVTKIEKGKSTSFDDAKAELTKLVADQVAQGKLVDIANVYSGAVNDGDDIAQAAKKAGMKLVHVGAVDAQGLAPDGTRAALPVDPDLLHQIFAAEVGEAGDPFSTTAGRTYGLAVQGVIPPKLKSLAVARADALRVWTNEQNLKRLQARAAELAMQARREGSLAGIARVLGAPVQNGPVLTRGNALNEAFAPVMLDRLFSAPPNGVVFGPAASGGGFVIARVSGVVHPPLNPLEQGYQQGLRRVSNQIAQDITDSLTQAERAKLNVTINQKLLDQAQGSGEGL